jgi:hypothetical protein
MAGLVVDAGFLYSQQRYAQAAADAAAIAAARDLLGGRSVSTAQRTAVTFVQTYHGLTAPPTSDVRIPPTTGPYAGRPQFAEVIVTHPVDTFLIHILPGVGQRNNVVARAVAGYEAVSAGEGVAVLDPDARPGIDISGGGVLRVNGRVIVNSEGGGEDQDGNPINNGNTGFAARAGQPNSLTGLFAHEISVVGGVDNEEQFKPYVPGGPDPLLTGQLPEPDPLINLPTPTTALGVDKRSRGSIAVSNQNVQGVETDSAGQNFVAQGGEAVANGLHTATAGQVILHPGIYDSIDITGGSVYMIPGIYVIASKKNNQPVLKITGGTVTAEGIMFYNTGNNYDPDTGSPDINDVNKKPPHDDGASLGGFSFNAGMRFRPIDTSRFAYSSLYSGAPAVSNKFDGMLFFQRRRSTQGIDIQGDSAEGVLSGTLYAKWANFKISGQGTYDAQFVAGSMSVTGQGNVTVLAAGGGRGRANQVFLVE